MTGNDVLFGEGQDDDIYGGSGYDRLYGGTGDDGILGDDGNIRTSRNGFTEPLNSLFTANAPDLAGACPDRSSGRRQHHGDIQKRLVVPVAAFDRSAAPTSSTAASAATSCTAAPATTRSPVPRRNASSTPRPRRPRWRWATIRPTRSATTRRRRKLAAYDADNPRTKIEGFLLNFDAYRIDESHRGGPVLGAAAGQEPRRQRPHLRRRRQRLAGGRHRRRPLFGGCGDDYLNARRQPGHRTAA